MSIPTTPATIYHGDFDATTRQHPALKYLEDYRNDYDTHNFDPKWYSPSYVYVAPDGTQHEGREPALVALKAMYGPLKAHFHEPFYLNCVETDYGYELLGRATLWADLPGEPAAGEQKKKDKKGKEWDMGGPGCFHFQLEKQGDGLRIRRTDINADTGPLVMGMLKRGVISTKDLGL